jgi:hypothetical protein
MRIRILAALAFCLTGNSYAALIDQGNGTVYDSDLGLIWLQDANHAASTGYTLGLLPPRADGRMTYAQAATWVADLTFAGFDDWYLPTQAQMEHLHFDELGNLIYSAPGYVPGDGDQGPFLGIAGSHYWSSAPGVIFNFKEGTSNSNASLDGNQFAAWAVREAAVVPVPAALWLFGSALGAASFFRRSGLR